MTVQLDELTTARPGDDPGAEPGPRARPRRDDAVWAAVVAAAATTLSTIAVASLLSGTRWHVHALGSIALVLVLGLLGRGLLVPRPAVVVTQLVACVGYVTALYAGPVAVLGFIPGPGATGRLRDRLDAGFPELDGVSVPFTPSNNAALIALVGVALTAVAVDALAVSYRRPLLAGVPLLVLYAIPALALPEGPRTWLFALPALGLLLLFVADDRERLVRWGLLPDRADLAHAGARRTGVRIAFFVLVISVAVPAAVPNVSAGLLEQYGIGRAKNAPIETLDPLVEMRRHLTRPADIDLLLVSSDTAHPEEQYLRTVTLDEFTGTQWKAADRTLAKFDTALPPVPGLSSRIPATPVESTIHGLPEFRTDYLPMPHPATSVVVEGKWKVDPTTSNVLSTKGLKQVADRDYTVTSLDLDPSRNDVGDTVPGEDLERYLQLPKLPEKIRETAKKVTKGAEHPLNIGLKLQAWFHNPLYFTYDLRNDLGSGSDAILAFIKDGAGNCEQFAATMAVMARTLGVPARVNVGFTAGEDIGGTRTISAHDAHAWPELFLPHIGWMRFEPTPGNASSGPTVPRWLRDGKAPQDDNSAEDEKGAEKGPEKGAESEKPAKENPEPPPPVDLDLDGGSTGDPLPSTGVQAGTPPASVSEPDDPSPWAAVLMWLGLSLLLLFALLALPWLLRTVQRRRRWALVAGGRESAAFSVEVAWTELRDTALDLGYAWPPARTPRQTAAALTREAPFGERAKGALTEITALVERARYSASGGDGIDGARIRGMVEEVAGALAVAVSRDTRIRARFAPRSLRTSLFRPAAARVRARLRGALGRVARRPAWPSRSS